MNGLDLLDGLVAAVRAGERYAQINLELVRWVAARELEKGRPFKEAVKAVRNKLHQVAGAYQERSLDFSLWKEELQNLPRNLTDPAVMEFCRQKMAFHSSTQERLPFLADFYTRILARFTPLHSILDLACGLNPLALPWMPLAADAVYYACDIYADMTGFLTAFMEHSGQRGKAELCDLVQTVPSQPVQVALLLKTIPCLEQLDKHIGRRLLDAIPAQHLVVSFPSRSLGGRSKGMAKSYSLHFYELVEGRDWRIECLEFPNEIVFLVSK